MPACNGLMERPHRERIENTHGFYDSTRVLGIGTVLGLPLMTFIENASTREHTRTRIEKRLVGAITAAVSQVFRDRLQIATLKLNLFY